MDNKRQKMVVLDIEGNDINEFLNYDVILDS